jgi:hypothetical protein
MTTRPARRRKPHVLALACALAAILGLLAASAQARSTHARRAATCASSSRGSSHGSSARARAKHGSRACARSHRKRGAHAQNTAGRLAPVAPGVAGAPAGSRQTAPTCESGAPPTRAEDGSFSCAGNDEPVCAAGSTPTVSRSGELLFCTPKSEQGSSFGDGSCEQASGAECVPVESNEVPELTCEDGSAPARRGVSFTCADGSRPACTDGSAPVVSSDGTTLVCEPAVTDE